MTITQKEREALDLLVEGMDEPFEGWLHEMLPETKQTSGLISSLIKKGLIESEPIDSAYYIYVTELGKNI